MTLAIELSAIGLATAFAAGFASFISPCVWPLVPGYLSFVSGVAYEDLERSTGRVVRSTAMFVAGFTLVFAAFGAGVGYAGAAISSHRRALELIAGVLVIAMGLALVGVAGRVFGREVSLRQRVRPISHAGALLTGIAFAIGWTPCIGPVLTAILLLATQTGGAGEGALLLLAYGLGLGVPFLAAGVALSRAMRGLGPLRRHAVTINRVAGAVLVVMGVLLATGRLTEITQRLSVYAV